MNSKTLTTEEVAEILRVDVRTVSRLIKRDHLPAFKVGNKWRFFRAEVEKWIKANRSGVLAIKEQNSLGVITEAKRNNQKINIVNIPVIGHIAAGLPILAEQNIEDYIPVSAEIASPGNKYFVLKVHGDSMNLKNIDDGDYILVKQQNYAEMGDIVVMLIEDEATVKMYYPQGEFVVLMPASTNESNKQIYLTKKDNFAIQGKYVMTLPKIGI